MTITTVTATTHSGQPITEWTPPGWATSTETVPGGFSYATETPAVSARTIDGTTVRLVAELAATDTVALQEDGDYGLDDRLTVTRTAPEVVFAGLTLSLEDADTFAVEILGMVDRVIDSLHAAAPALAGAPTSAPTVDPDAARRSRMLARVIDSLHAAGGTARLHKLERALFDASRRKEARAVIVEASRDGLLSLTDGVLSLPADDVRPALKAVR